MARGRRQTYSERKTSAQETESAKPRHPGPKPADGEPGLPAWQDAAKAYVLQEGGFKYFVQMNGRLYDYHPGCHDRMADAFERAVPKIGVQKVQQQHLRLYPRNSLKTTMEEELMAWAMLKYPKIQMQYIRATKELAAEVLFEVRNEALVTPFIQSVWGSVSEVSNKDNQYEFSIGTNKDPTIRCFGIEGSLTGTHCDFAIIDDAVTDANFTSRALSRQVRSRFANLRPILNPQHGNKLVSGTFWPKATIYDEILAQQAALEKKFKLALDLGNKDEMAAISHKMWDIDMAGVHNPDGTLFFPKLDENFLRLVREDPEEGQYYPGWYEMVPCGGGTTYFPKDQRKWFKGQLYHDPMPHIAVLEASGAVYAEVPVDVHMTYDGTLTANSGSDFVGITINAVSAENKDRDETWYILSSKKYRELPSTMTDIVCLQLMVFRPLYLWAEPGCISAEMMADVQKFISLHELPTAIRDLKLSKKAGAKEKRINALQTRYKKGQIRLQEGPWCRDLTEEMDLWTGIADLEHDDGLDSLSMQSGIAKPCGIEKLSELFEEDPRDDPEWDDPGMMGDWNARPWQGINIAEAAKRSFDGGPSRFAMQLEEAGKQVVNMEQMYPNESEHKRRIGGHAGIHSRRKGQK
jgi:hypothetical protein